MADDRFWPLLPVQPVDSERPGCSKAVTPDQPEGAPSSGRFGADFRSLTALIFRLSGTSAVDPKSAAAETTHWLLGI
jgi:hypothetical protein